jgi:hypothetical protein
MQVGAEYLAISPNLTNGSYSNNLLVFKRPNFFNKIFPYVNSLALICILATSTRMILLGDSFQLSFAIWSFSKP